jgi:hypothetical protein
MARQLEIVLLPRHAGDDPPDAAPAADPLAEGNQRGSWPDG